jgi:Rha family phage regulatory protein
MTETALAPAVRPAPPAPVFALGGKSTTSSRDVADYFGKQHKDVLHRIDTLDCSKGFHERSFTPVEYLDLKGEPRRMYQMNRDGFSFLAMGFTGRRAAAFKEGYIDAFNAMEEQLRSYVSVDMLRRLVDAQQNYIDVLKRTQRPPRKERGYATVTDEVAAEVLRQAAEGWDNQIIAGRLHLSRVTVNQIRNGTYGPIIARQKRRAELGL